MNPHVALTEVAFELRGGDMLVLYTDGVRREAWTASPGRNG
jgi:serine phosphatase RsbU (regulator of sigma subunit)